MDGNREATREQLLPELSVYQQLPLKDANSIRLLRLKPCTEDSNSIIEAELYVASLSEVQQRFDALSYTWNSQTRDRSILVNDVNIHIGQNLHDFLLRMRDCSVAMPLWADAICINQHNNEEKNHQVRLMGDIYSTARCTRIWLGNELNDLSKLMEIYEIFGHIRWEQDAVSNLCIDASSLLGALLHHPYWQRTWIIQEILLATEVQVHCRSQVLQWDKFMTVTKRICARIGQSCLAKYGASKMKQLDMQITEKSPQTLPGLLERYGRTSCGDHRDRVFAMIGLIDAEHDPLRLRSKEDANIIYIVDYSASLPVLFTRLLKIYSHCAPASFLTNLWFAFQLDAHSFSKEESNITVAAYLRHLNIVTLPVSESNYLATTLFEKEKIGTWVHVEFPWCSEDRSTYWKLQGGPFEDDIRREGLILGCAVSWAPKDGCESLLELADKCCETARGIRIASLQEAADGWLKAEFTIGFMKDHLGFDQFPRMLAKHISAYEVVKSTGTMTDSIEICLYRLASETEELSDLARRMAARYVEEASKHPRGEPLYVADVAWQNLVALFKWAEAVSQDSAMFLTDFKNGLPAPALFDSWKTFAMSSLDRHQYIQEWRRNHFLMYQAPFPEIGEFLKTVWKEKESLGAKEKSALAKIFAERMQPKAGEVSFSKPLLKINRSNSPPRKVTTATSSSEPSTVKAAARFSWTKIRPGKSKKS